MAEILAHGMKLSAVGQSLIPSCLGFNLVGATEQTCSRQPAGHETKRANKEKGVDKAKEVP